MVVPRAHDLIHVGVLVHLAISPFWLAITVRRLHDTGRSARWLLPYTVVAPVWALIIYWSVNSLFGPGAGEEQSELGFVLIAVLLSAIWVLATLACTMMLLMVLCSQPGMRGANRYGPDPLRPGPDAKGPGSQQLGRSAVPAGTPPQTEASGERRCARCGVELPQEARFCPACGTGAQT